MNGLIYDIKRFAVHDGPGIRTTVFFKACPLQCWWCHNPESISKNITEVETSHFLDGKEFKRKEQTGYLISAKDLLEEIMKDEQFFRESGGGVTFSGGEPLLQPEFLIETINLCQKRAIHITIDTSGYAQNRIFKKVIQNADLLLFDLKQISDKLHRKYTGVGNKMIIRNLRTAVEMNIHVIIRYPLIPGINDTPCDMQRLNRLLLQEVGGITEIDLLPFHKIADHKYEKLGLENKMKNTPEPSDEDIQKAIVLLTEMGFNVKTGGVPKK